MLKCSIRSAAAARTGRWNALPSARPLFTFVFARGTEKGWKFKGNWWSEDIMSIMYCKESQQKLKISEPAWWHGESLSWYSEIYFMSKNLRHETKSTYIKTYIFIRTQSLLSIMSRTFLHHSIVRTTHTHIYLPTLPRWYYITSKLMCNGWTRRVINYAKE